MKEICDFDFFYSSVNGERVLQYKYILEGNRFNISYPSPSLKDLWIEFVRFKGNVANTTFIVQHASSIVPDAQVLDQLIPGMLRQDDGVISIQHLTHNYFWIGDENNYPVETNVILPGSLYLDYNYVFVGNSDNVATSVPNILLQNLPPFLDLTALTSNCGIYNLYTGSALPDITNPTRLPGTPTTTLRIDESNLPNLRKGRMWIGTINYTPPITVIPTFPYINITGNLNWDPQGYLDDDHAVPMEIGLGPGQIFIGDFDNPGEITTRGLPNGQIFIGNPSGQIVTTGLPFGKIFIGDSGNHVTFTGLLANQIFVGNASDQVNKLSFGAGQMLYCNLTGSLVADGLNAHQLWGGDPANTGQIIKITVLDISNLPNLSHARIWMGNGLNRPFEASLGANQLFIGNSTGTGDIGVTVILPIDNMANLPTGDIWIGDSFNRPSPAATIAIGNLPSLPFGDLWTGDATDRPIAVTQIAVLNLPPLTSNKIWRGNVSNRPAEVSLIGAGGITITNNLTDITFTGSGGTVTRIDTGTGLTGGPITSSGTISMASIILPGAAEYASITYNAQGQITSAIDNLATITGIESDIATLDTTVAGLASDVAAIDLTLYAPGTGVVDVLAATVAGLAALGVTVAAIDTSLGIVIGDVNNLKDVKYIVQQPHAGVPNAQALNALGGGMLRANSSGVVSIDANATGLADLPGTGYITRISTGNFGTRTFQVGGELSISNADGTGGNTTISLSDNLHGFSIWTGTGIVVKQSTGVYTGRSIAVGGELSVSNADGISGNPTISLSDNLYGFSIWSGTGIVLKTSLGVYTNVSIAGGTGINVTNGNGLGGNPTINISNTSVSAGTYVYPSSVTVNAQGQLTSITSGAPVLSVTGTANQITIGGTSQNPIIAIANNAILPGNGSVTVPVGTTAQRPASPTVGMIRFNTDTGRLETYY